MLCLSKKSLVKAYRGGELSDEDKDVLKSYGAWGIKKMYGREYEGIYRCTYIINEDQVVEKVFSKVTTKTHAKDVLAEL